VKFVKLPYILGVALLVALSMTQRSEARIVYTRAHVVISINNYYDLDLNHDGVADFTIKNAGNYGRYRLYASVPAGNGVVGGIGSNGAQAAALIRGEQIGPGQMFVAPDVTMRECIRHAICWGDWDNVTNRYLGLKFKIKGQSHYGWARLSVQVSGTTVTGTLTGYAYETIPNKTIIAGNTKGAHDAESAPASVTKHTPERPTLGMLAKGSPALSIWRRWE